MYCLSNIRLASLALKLKKERGHRSDDSVDGGAQIDLVIDRADHTMKSLFLTLITTYGVRDNAYARSMVARTVTLDALFDKN